MNHEWKDGVCVICGASLLRCRTAKLADKPSELWAQAFAEYPNSIVGRICRYQELMDEEGYVIDYEQAFPADPPAPVAPKGDATMSACVKCGKEWINGTCEDTPSRRGLCFRNSEPPVRLCCGERHFGVVCPDDHIMCCICFERFPIDPSTEWDVCPSCLEHEANRAVPVAPEHESEARP